MQRSHLLTILIAGVAGSAAGVVASLADIRALLEGTGFAIRSEATLHTPTTGGSLNGAPSLRSAILRLRTRIWPSYL